jgi:hypothetical protein
MKKLSVFILLIPLWVSAACHNWTFVDFSGGVDGAAPTTNTLNASTFGVGGWQWGFNNLESLLTFANAGQHTMPNNVNICSVGVTTGATSPGFQCLQSDVSSYSPLNLFITNGLSKMSASVWIKHTFPFTNSTSYDLFTISSADGQQFVNAKLGQNTDLDGMWVSMESPANSGGSDVYPPRHTALIPGQWYRFDLYYDSNADSLNMQIFIYDSNLNLFEQLQNNNAPASVKLAYNITMGVQDHGNVTPTLKGVCGALYDNLIIDAGVSPVFPFPLSNESISANSWNKIVWNKGNL